jgi:REP element-mobilizing transposase RayT
MRASAAQLEFTSIVEAPVRPAKRTWGGARAGAGRPRKAEKDRKVVAHRPRGVHKKRHPIHVTVRARRGLPSFRSQRIHDMVRRVLKRQLRNPRYRDQFQVVHYSVQSNHLHLIVEATDARAMRSGVSGLVIAFAKRLNKEILRRLTGKVWGDRYHSRELTSPTAVRRALVYVLQNVRKHGFELAGAFVDPLGSAKGFDGWSVHVPAPTDENETFSAGRPRTWLLGEGWSTRGGGLLSPCERPT